MKNNYLHLYCGDGKGKTTCAMGLAIRAVGRGIPVTIAQFLKGEDSGERRVLEQLPEVNLFLLPQQVKFSFRMNEEEKQEAAQQCQQRFQEAISLASVDGGLLIFDEICAAISTGFLPLEQVLSFLDNCPEGLEVVMTGRDPAPELLERADYVTVMRKEKHPYDRGITARRGIEY